MATCQFCSTEIPAGDQFCGRCGARAPVAPAGAASAPPTPPSTPPQGPGFGAPAPVDPQGDFGAPPPRWESPSGFASYAPAVAARRYAGFWIRVGAYLLDLVFALLLALIPGIVLAVVIALLVEAGQDTPLTAFEADQQDEDTALGAIIGFFVGFVLVYYAYQYIATSLGGGWGKRICGLRIIKMDTGEKPGYGTGAIRVAVIIGIGAVGNIPFIGWIGSLLNYLWMIWDKDKQTFHDKAAGTVVVHA